MPSCLDGILVFLVVPQVWLEPSSDPITVVAGQPARIRCVVGQARPAPTIQWMIGAYNALVGQDPLVGEPP